MLSFWGIYAIDRELIYPVRLDEHLPQILNHYWVSIIIIIIVIVIIIVIIVIVIIIIVNYSLSAL